MIRPAPTAGARERPSFGSREMNGTTSNHARWKTGEYESSEDDRGYQHEGNLKPATEAEEKAAPLLWRTKVAAKEAPVNAGAQETAEGVFACQEVQRMNVSERGISGRKCIVF